MSKRIYLLIIVLILGCVGAGVYFLHNSKNVNESANQPPIATTTSAAAGATAQVGTTTLQLAVADTPAARQQGLSGRRALPKDGMLFVFERQGRHGFWMKDMQFPIDIIWLNEKREVVGLEENADPDSYPQTFYPQQPALYVIETTAGFIQRQKIEYGDSLKIRLSE